MSVRDLARFVGKALASAQAIREAPLHYRAVSALQFSINSMTPENHPMECKSVALKFNANLTLTTEAVKDLNWWVSLDRKAPMQFPLIPQAPSMTIVGCFQYGMGSPRRQTTDGGKMVSGGSLSPY